MSGDGVTIQPHKKKTKNARGDLMQKHLYKRVSVFRLSYRTHYHHPAIPSVPDRSLLSTNAMFPLFFSSPRISLLPRVCAFSPHFSFLNRRRVGTDEKKNNGRGHWPKMGAAAQHPRRNRVLSKEANPRKKGRKGTNFPPASITPGRNLDALVNVSLFLSNFEIIVPFPGPPGSRKQKTCN